MGQHRPLGDTKVKVLKETIVRYSGWFVVISKVTFK